MAITYDHPSRRHSRPSLVTMASISTGMATIFVGACILSLPFTFGGQDDGNDGQEVLNSQPELLRLPVVTHTLGQGTVRQTFQAQGRLQPARRVLLSVPDAGIIGEVRVEIGETVAANQILAVMVAPPDEALRMSRAKDRFARAKRDLDRFQAVRDQSPNAVSDQQWQRLEAAQEDARFEVDMLEQARQLREIRAPFAGVVAQLSGIDGQMVSRGFAVAELHDVTRYELPLELPEIALQGLRLSGKVAVRSVNHQQDADGSIVAMPQTIDPDRGTGRVLVGIAQPPQAWRSGSFALVDFITEESTNTIVIPSAAVRYQRNRPYVWVVKDDALGGHLVSRTWLQLGISDGDHYVVISGVETGDEVVVGGLSGLTHLAPIAIEESGTQTVP